MKKSVGPKTRVEPEPTPELEAALEMGNSLTQSVETGVRKVNAMHQAQSDLLARAQAASDEYHRSGISMPVEPVLARMQAKLDARRKQLAASRSA